MSEVLTVSTSKKKKEAEIVEIFHPVSTRIHEVLARLHSLKSHRYPKYWKFREEYAQRSTKTKNEDGYASYNINTWFAIINAKKADVITNTPKFDFVAMDDDGKKYKRVRELFWKYVWETSHTDHAIMQIIQDALQFGVGFGEETVIDKRRKVSTPTKDSEGNITYVDEEICEYKWSKLIHLPWSQVYLNGSNIENTTEAITITYWDRDEFLLTFWNDTRFTWVTDADIPKWKYYYVSQWSDVLSINGSPSATDRAATSVENAKIVSVLTYYNKYRDEYIVLANGKWINPKNGDIWQDDVQSNIQPIPFPHKEIPILVYTDHVIQDDIYALGEMDITEWSRQLKNDIRSLRIEWVKAQWGIITVWPDADFDETVMRLGMRQIARVEKDSFGFFAPNVDINSLDNFDKKVDEDIIVETWTDFKAQLFWPNETAARTEWRIAAAKKRINDNIKYNAYTFYERLARLRSANFEFVYKYDVKKLPVKGVEVASDWSVEYVQNGYWLFTMKPEYFSWKIALIPVVDSLYGDTSSETKQKYLETLQLLINMKDAQWAPLFDQRVLIEAGRWIIDEVIDLDKVLGKSNDTKSPEDIMKEAWLWDTSQNPADQMNWGWGIPPAQQSGAPVLLWSSPKW